MRARKMTVGLMAVMALVFVAASAHAKAGAVCKSNSKGDVLHTGTDGSDCEADCPLPVASRRQPRRPVALRKPFLTRRASRPPSRPEKGTADATSDKHAKATAKASGAGHRGRYQRSELQENAQPQQTPPRAGRRKPQCEAGGFVHATATNSGTAVGFDDAPPIRVHPDLLSEPRPCTSSGLGNC